MEQVFFDDGSSLLRVLVTVPLVYASVVLFIRIVGKRATSQMNNFDWIVTVAMGSMVASCILLRDVVLLDAMGGVALLLLLQYGVTWLSARSDRVEALVKATPRLLVYRGRYQSEAMERERISREEVRAAIRGAGISRMADVAAVVLESDAKMSVIGLSAIEPQRDADLLSELDVPD